VGAFQCRLPAHVYTGFAVAAPICRSGAHAAHLYGASPQSAATQLHGETIVAEVAALVGGSVCLIRPVSVLFLMFVVRSVAECPHLILSA